MYNQGDKERYIEYKKGITILPEYGLERLFEKTEKFEKRNNKDICCFVEKEILALYKTLGTRSIGLITNYNSYLAQYTDWAMGQGLVSDGQNHFRVLKKTDFESCINIAATKQLDLTRERLLAHISHLVNAREKFILLYLFECGAKQYASEFQDLTIDQFKGNKLYLKTRTVDVSNELVSFAKEAAKADELYPYKEGGHIQRFITEPDGHIIQFRIREGNNKESRNRYYALYLVAVSYLGLDMYKPKEIDYMGRIEFIRNKAKENHITPQEVVYTPEYLLKLQEQYGFSGTANYFWDVIKRYI